MSDGQRTHQVHQSLQDSQRCQASPYGNSHVAKALGLPQYTHLTDY